MYRPTYLHAGNHWQYQPHQGGEVEVDHEDTENKAGKLKGEEEGV